MRAKTIKNVRFHLFFWVKFPIIWSDCAISGTVKSAKKEVEHNQKHHLSLLGFFVTKFIRQLLFGLDQLKTKCGRIFVR